MLFEVNIQYGKIILANILVAINIILIIPDRIDLMIYILHDLITNNLQNIVISPGGIEYLYLGNLIVVNKET